MLFSESSARDRSDLTFRNLLEKNANSILNCLPVAESQLGKVFTTHGIYFYADQQKKNLHAGRYNYILLI